MKIHIPPRVDAPETNLFAKIIKRFSNTEWDRDVMILIPGGPGGNHTLYADIEESLLEYADLVILDLRGCGYSDKADVRFCTLEHHIRDIEAVRIALNINKPIIHGCSYGAIVALGYAISPYSENLSKLILSSCAASGDFIRAAQENLKKRGTPEQIKIAELLWEGKFESPEQFAEYYKTMAPLYVYHAPKPEELPILKYNIPYNTDLVNYAFKGFLLEFDYRPHLTKVKTPTLIFSGKNDWIIDTEQAEILYAGIARSTLITLDECGHFPWKDQKSAFLSSLKFFLNPALDCDNFNDTAFRMARIRMSSSDQQSRTRLN
ncbi:alpha/beta fold hydrolase [Legionella dresdenensis]|uniref:Alpha/beta fold hydrolase n=1 Tax=Legionella dresdenensis TaxID=450200 RepID=A0ABV8CGW5_9GAMM